MAEIETRLALLEDERAILRTLHTYGHTIDSGDEAGWLDCFTADGVFGAWITSPEEPWFRVAGRDELAAFISEHTRPPDPAHKHLLIEPLIDVAAGTCVSYFAVLMHYERRADPARLRPLPRPAPTRRRRPLALRGADRRDPVDEAGRARLRLGANR